MAEDATVTIFKVSRCGYYDPETEEQTLAPLRDVVSDLNSWLANKDLGDTCTYVENEDLLFLRTFCMDYVESKGSALFVSWNESEKGANGVKSVSENDAVGQASIKTHKVGEHDIPGYPSFFWILPQDGLVVNIRFDDRQNGSQPFQYYLSNFLTNHARWCVYGKRDGSDLDGEVPLLGYSADGKNPQSLVPLFSTVLNHRAGEIEFIKNNVDKIYKVVRKKYLKVRCKEDNDLVRDLLVAARIRKQKITSLYNRVRYEIPFKPDLDTLNGLISSWDADPDKGDIGVRIRGEASHIYWIGRSLSRDKIDLDVRRKGDGMIDSASLMAALEKKKEIILALRN